MNQRRQEIKDHKDMLRAQIKSANEEKQTVRWEINQNNRKRIKASVPVFWQFEWSHIVHRLSLYKLRIFFDKDGECVVGVLRLSLKLVVPKQFTFKELHDISKHGNSDLRLNV